MIGTSNKLITYLIEQAKDKKFVLEEYKEVRTKDANAYFHVLVNQLARHLNISDRDMKIQLNLRYGTIARDDNGTPVGVKIPHTSDITQFYDYAKWFGECEENGIIFDKYIFYKQTHTLNTKEMSQLINGVVQECKDNGLEVRPQSEIDSMLERWDKHEQKK